MIKVLQAIIFHLYLLSLFKFLVDLWIKCVASIWWDVLWGERNVSYVIKLRLWLISVYLNFSSVWIIVHLVWGSNHASSVLIKRRPVFFIISFLIFSVVLNYFASLCCFIVNFCRRALRRNWIDIFLCVITDCYFDVDFSLNDSWLPIITTFTCHYLILIFRIAFRFLSYWECYFFKIFKAGDFWNTLGIKQ